MADKSNPVTVDEIVAAAAAGVLRALDARSSGGQLGAMGSQELVRAGFNVRVHIYAGGIPQAEVLEARE